MIELELQLSFNPDQKVCAASLEFPADALTCSDTVSLILSLDSQVPCRPPIYLTSLPSKAASLLLAADSAKRNYTRETQKPVEH